MNSARLVKQTVVVVSQQVEQSKEYAFGLALYSILHSLALTIRRYYCGDSPRKCEHCGK